MRLLLVLALLRSTAHANPYPSEPPAPSDHLHVSLGLLVGGGGPSHWLYGALAGELGVTIPQLPILVRGRLFGVFSGGTVESDWGGDFSRSGLGVELRACTRRATGCLFGDFDFGYQHLTLFDHNGEFVREDKGMFVGPRVGFDAGGSVRFRFAIELYRQHTDRTRMSGEAIGSFGTVGITFGLGYQR